MTIDLRSDTVTRPTEAMRAAMASAEVGDDVYGEDPSVRALEERAAELFGKDAALFVPSGVMANQLGLRVLSEPGTEVIVEADAHLVDYEGGAGAILAGVQFRTVPSEAGVLDPADVRDAIRPDAYHLTPTSLLALEQTHNRRGGVVTPLQRMEELSRVAREAGVHVWLDGARIFNASVAAQVEVHRYAACVDGLMFSLSKGLGAPVGSVLVSDLERVELARTWRRRYGGAMRQAGVIACAGSHALDHHVERLTEDHANARLMAEIIADAVPEAVELDQVQTNMVYVDTAASSATDTVGALAADGILVGALGPTTVRLVTHLDVRTEQCRRAGRAVAALLGGSRP